MSSILTNKETKFRNIFFICFFVLASFVSWKFSNQNLLGKTIQQRCQSLIDQTYNIKNAAINVKNYELVDFINYVCELQNVSNESNLDQVVAPKDNAGQVLSMIQESLSLSQSKDQVSTFDIAKMGFYNFLSPLFLKFSRTDSLGEISVKDQLIWSEKKSVLDFDKFNSSQGKNGQFKWAIFEKYSVTGSTAKIRIKELEERSSWNLKWGDEVHSDAVASRLFFKLGYNVDYGVYRTKDSFKLILNPELDSNRSVAGFVRFIYNVYRIDIAPFISKRGEVSEQDIALNPYLKPYLHKTYITFKSSYIEYRNDQEIRLGPAGPSIYDRPEYRASLLAHIWIGNWDVKENNTLITLIKETPNQFQFKFYFNDLGASLGVHINPFPRDLKSGLVNEFEWNVAESNNEEIKFITHMNSITDGFKKASYGELKWMAKQILGISKEDLVEVLQYSGWPEEIKKIYFSKLASRRANILKVFDLEDLHPISFEGKTNLTLNKIEIIKDNILLQEYDLENYPEGFFNKKGRFRGFGWN